MTTCDQAYTYANEYNRIHEVDESAALGQQQETMFMGSTLVGLLSLASFDASSEIESSPFCFGRFFGPIYNESMMCRLPRSKVR